jgi:hypothetical protein
MQQTNDAFTEISEISLGRDTKQSKITIAFSPDGEYLALLYRKKPNAILKIYKIDEYDITGLL